jgi:hypothetical protein
MYARYALGKRRMETPLVPAKAGTQSYRLRPLGSRFRGNERTLASVRKGIQPRTV